MSRKKNSWAALFEPAKPKRSAGSRAARAAPHDWDELYRIVEADSRKMTPSICLDWDEQYVHAIQQALVGRDNSALLKMLGEGRLLHPALMPALAGVIQSQRDGGPGRGKVLTRHQDRMIRDLYDRLEPLPASERPVPTTKKWLAEAFKTTVATIERSLNETKPKAK
jgi:hypothetical protein